MARLAIAVVVSCAFGSAYAAQGITAEGIARVDVALGLILNFCPATHIVDMAQARKLHGVTFELGAKSFGRAAFGKLYDIVLEQREKEMIATGIGHWCEYQSTVPYIEGLKLILGPKRQ